MFLDTKFQFLEDKVVSTTPNKNGAHDHVPEVERHIKLIKEKIRSYHANQLYLASHDEQQ